MACLVCLAGCRNPHLWAEAIPLAAKVPTIPETLAHFSLELFGPPLCAECGRASCRIFLAVVASLSGVLGVTTCAATGLHESRACIWHEDRVPLHQVAGQFCGARVAWRRRQAAIRKHQDGGRRVARCRLASRRLAGCRPAGRGRKRRAVPPGPTTGTTACTALR